MQLICAEIVQSILQILVMDEKNVWIFVFHIEEFFNNLDSTIVIRIYGLFGYLWHVIDINKITFTLDMNSIITKSHDWIF